MTTAIRLSFALLLAAGCATTPDPIALDPGPDTSMVVRLTWKPTDRLDDVSVKTMSLLAEQRLKVYPFKDQRQPVDRIGQNVEQSPVRPVVTKDDVGLYVGTQVASMFQSLAVPIVTAGETRVLRGEVARFFVNEDNFYNADVVLRFTLQDADGRELWKGVAAGRSKRWGRSFSAENYHEALSNALMEAVKGLLDDPAFLAAYGGFSR